MFVVLPLLLLLFGSSPTARAKDDEHGFIVVAPSSLKPRAVCSGHRVIPPRNRTWLPLNRLLGPCSPSLSAAAAKPSLADLLRQDQLRVDDIHRRLSYDYRESKGSFKEPAVVEETQLHHQSTVQFKVGSESKSSESFDPAATGGSSSTPAAGKVQTVVLDTASDLPWVQCMPCPIQPCPYYDPSRSSTYAAFPCNSSACRRLGPYATGCVNNQCQYRVTYLDGSFSSGTYSSDLLTIDGTNTISNFKFGCSHAEQGSFDGQADGIMALGGGVQSLVAQSASTYGNAFSYCLPRSESDKGFFSLGVPSEASSRFVLTPMLRDKQMPTFYRVLLLAITVAGQELNLAPEVFAAGTVLDSRTVITHLPLTAYEALRAAFRDRMAIYPEATQKENLDTCYNFTGVRNIRLPRIALVFDRNAVVELHQSGILYENCLAFTSNSDDSTSTILGNVQQKTIEVFHNVGGGAVGFRRAAC